MFSKDGQIDADELQKCLTQSGIAGTYKRKFGKLNNTSMYKTFAVV